MIKELLKVKKMAFLCCIYLTATFCEEPARYENFDLFHPALIYIYIYIYIKKFIRAPPYEIILGKNRGGSIFLFWDRAKVWHDPGLLV